MGVAVAIDIALNPLLIRGIGPFPRLGIAGSATSTFIAQGISLACLVVVLYRRRSPLALGWSERRLLVPAPRILKSLVVRGLPMGLQILVMSGAALVMIGFVNSYGAVTAAAFTSASQVWTFVQLPAMALGAAVSSMAAQNVGAGRWDRVSRVARAGVWSGLIVTGLLAAAIYALGDTTLGLFLPPGSDALPIARHINQLVLWAFVFFSITFVLSGVVRATGAVWAPLVILLGSMYVIRIPFAMLLKGALGADAIWWSFPLGTVSSAVLTTAYYRRAGWKKARMVDGPRPTGQAADAGLATPAVAPAVSESSLAETS
jgi:Na+-driven multidrug efflux pump